MVLKQDSNVANVSKLAYGLKLFPQVRLLRFSTKFYAEKNGKPDEVLGRIVAPNSSTLGTLYAKIRLIVSFFQGPLYSSLLRVKYLPWTILELKNPAPNTGSSNTVSSSVNGVAMSPTRS